MVCFENFLNILILSPSNIENEEVREQIVANPFDGQKGSARVLLYEHKHTLNILLYESSCSTSHSRAEAYAQYPALRVTLRAEAYA